MTQLRVAIRKLLACADRYAAEVAAAVHAVLTREDDYATVVRCSRWLGRAGRLRQVVLRFDSCVLVAPLAIGY